MTASSSSNVNTADSPYSAPRQPRSALVAILLLVIALLVVTIGVLVVDRQRLSAQLEDARASHSPTQSEQGAATQSDKETGADPAKMDPELLTLIRSQARRDPKDGRAQGSVDAPVVMVLYSDFSCPYCTLFATEVEPGLHDLVEDGTLRIEWRDLAQITETSPLAAQAGIAAAEQGKFWEFHDLVYAAADPNAHPDYTIESLTAFAQQAGVSDLDAFTRTMTSDATVKAVAQAKQDAYAIGVTGTPFLFIGDTYMSGYHKLDEVRRTIKAQAAAGAQSK